MDSIYSMLFMCSFKIYEIQHLNYLSFYISNTFSLSWIRQSISGNFNYFPALTFPSLPYLLLFYYIIFALSRIIMAFSVWFNKVYRLSSKVDSEYLLQLKHLHLYDYKNVVCSSINTLWLWSKSLCTFLSLKMRFEMFWPLKLSWNLFWIYWCLPR